MTHAQTDQRAPAYVLAPGELRRNPTVSPGVKSDSTDTAGLLGVFEDTLAPWQSGPPLHLHAEMDEAFYVLEGGVETAVVIAAKQHTVSLRAMVWVVGGFRLVAAVVALLAWGLALAFHWLPSLEAQVLLIVGVGSVIRLFQTPFSAALQVRDKQATV